MLRLCDMKSSSYRFNIQQQISTVYYDRHRELLREFFTLREFEDHFFRQDLSVINDQLHTYFSLGYNYLDSQKDEGFIEFTFNDDNINFNYAYMDEIKSYVLRNALAHLFAHCALWLMDNSDIEDYLAPNYELVEISRGLVTFSYRK